MADRRHFLLQAAAVSSAAISSIRVSTGSVCQAQTNDANSPQNESPPTAAAGRIERLGGTRVKLGLNAFTFNHELLSGRMTMHEVIDFCAENHVDGVDMTGYYFPGYPAVCDDQTLFDLKRYAFINGVTISGTGVRNSFTTNNENLLAESIRHTHQWIEVAAKIGSDVLRVFSGKKQSPGPDRETANARLIESLKQCSVRAQEHGVMLGLQHHHDFLKTADQTLDVIAAVDSPWCGVVLDVGSLREKNVYQEIERLLPYTTTWQIKEQVWVDGEQVAADLDRIAEIIDRVGYRGFLPIEVLGKDDTVEARKEHAAVFLEQVRQRMIG